MGLEVGGDSGSFSNGCDGWLDDGSIGIIVWYLFDVHFSFGYGCWYTRTRGRTRTCACAPCMDRCGGSDTCALEKSISGGTR